MLFVILALVGVAVIIWLLVRVADEDCCPHGKGCNEPGFVLDRRCWRDEAFETVDEIETTALRIAWLRVESAPRGTLRHASAKRDYETIRDNAREGRHHRALGA